MNNVVDSNLIAYILSTAVLFLMCLRHVVYAYINNKTTIYKTTITSSIVIAFIALVVVHLFLPSQNVVRIYNAILTAFTMVQQFFLDMEYKSKNIGKVKWWILYIFSFFIALFTGACSIITTEQFL